VNHSIKEIDWIKDVSQAQYRSQINRDPFFNPETRLSPTPPWVKDQVRDSERRSFVAPESATVNVHNEYTSTDRRNTSDPNHSRTATRSAKPIRAEASPEVSKSSERIAPAILGDFTKTSAAQIESGIYKGRIIAATQDLLLQRELSARLRTVAGNFHLSRPEATLERSG
jgi:hypothetical protein